MKVWKNMFPVAIAAVGITMFTLSCKKDDESPQLNNPPVWAESGENGMDSFFENNLEEAKEVFTINPLVNQTITGAQGLMLFTPPSFLVDANGNAVTGEVQVEMVQISKKSDMVLLKKTTMSNGLLLESGGEFFVDFKQNGLSLNLAPEKEVFFTLPSSQSNPMQLFRGNVMANGDVNWNLDETTQIWGGGGMDTIGFQGSLGDSLRWINCDYFYNAPNNTVVSVEVPADFGNLNANCFFYFTELDMIAAAIPDLECKCFKSYDSGLPIGEKVRIISMGEKDEKLYVGSTDETVITADHHFVLDFTETTEDAIENLVSSWD